MNGSESETEERLHTTCRLRIVLVPNARKKRPMPTLPVVDLHRAHGGAGDTLSV